MNTICQKSPKTNYSGMYNYSFIIPHRNTPDLLQHLLDTIPQREDVEIVIVDDNSDPAVVDFERFPGNTRSNIQIVFNKEAGRGAGYARNLGLEIATGEWLLFADSDDYYTTHVDDLLNNYQTNRTTDVVYLNAQLFDENGVFKPHHINKLINDFLEKKPYAEMLLRYSVWTPWTRMVRRQLVIEHQLRFEEVPAANDKNFCLECSRYAKSIAVETDFIYNYYRPSTQSQTDKKRNSMALDSMIKVRSHTNEIYAAVNYKYKLSYFTLFHKSLYAQDIPFILRWQKYFRTLKDNKVSLITDLFRYYKGKLTKNTH